MNVDPNDLPEHIKRLNPHLFGLDKVEKPFTKPNLTRALDSAVSSCETGPKSVVISLVSYRRTRLDNDNLAASFKPLQDCIAATLGVDDADERLRWEYGQIETRGQQGTMVKIEAK